MKNISENVENDFKLGYSTMMQGISNPEKFKKIIFHSFELPMDTTECSFHCTSQIFNKDCVFFIYEDSTCFIGSKIGMQFIIISS